MAILTIHGREVEFDFKSITNWKTKGGDPFALNVNIGGQNCFVKKFKKKPPKSKDLLAHFDDRETIGIPTVFEYQEVDELGEPVFYLVQKMVSGEVFEDILRKEHHKVDLQRFVQQVFWGFKEIHNEGYWHCDFCFQNLMADVQAKQYTLIDIDSCLHMSESPNIDRAINQDLIGGIGLMFEELGYIFDWDNLDGKKYNYLQLAMAVFHLSHCNNDAKLDARPKSIRKTATIFLKNNSYAINFLLNGIVNGFTTTDFEKVIPKISSYTDLMDSDSALKNIDQTLLQKVEKIGLIRKFGTEPTLPSTPKFNHFEVNGRTTVLNVEKGEVVTVKWNVSNAVEVLYNGNVLGKTKKGETKIKITQPTDIQLEAVNRKNGEEVYAKSNKIAIRIKEEHIITPSIELIIDGKKLNPNYANINCDEEVEIQWKGIQAKELYFNNQKVKSQDSKRIRINKSSINLQFKAVNYGTNRSKVETYNRTISLHKRLQEPVINFVELNGKRSNYCVVSAGEEVTLTWNTKNANQIFVNDKFISDKSVGVHRFVVKEAQNIWFKAVNCSENGLDKKIKTHKTLKINVRPKVREEKPYAKTPKIYELTFNQKSVLNKSIFEVNKENNIEIYIRAIDADLIHIKRSIHDKTPKIIRGNEGRCSYNIDELIGSMLIVKLYGKSFRTEPKIISKTIQIIKQYPILSIQKLEINGQDMINNPVYKYKKDEELNLALNISNANKVLLNNNPVNSKGIFNLKPNQKDNKMTLTIDHYDENGNIQKLNKYIKLEKLESKSYGWVWFLLLLIIAFIIFKLGIF